MRRIFFIVILLSIFIVGQSQLPAGPSLLPLPQQLITHAGWLSINKNFTISVKTKSPDTILLKAANRMQQTIGRRTGLRFIQGRITSQNNEDSATLIVLVDSVASPVIGTNESYQIDINPGRILLKAPTTLGALHGLETLIQLVSKNDQGFYFPALSIQDAPRFVWRGLTIDVARHFIPVDVVERNIEAMSAVKMNVLHLHLSDDEGFRVESKAFPFLHTKGSNGEFYTQAQIRELVSFASDRGIVIIPEFDMPGHCKSWLAGYPQIASAPGDYQPGPALDLPKDKKLDLPEIMRLVNTTPVPTMDPTRESTYVFLDRFLDEMSRLFPSPYIHIGADENNGVAWKNNPQIVSFMEKNKMPDTHALQAYFVDRVHKIVSNHHKTMIGWEELFSDNLAKDVIVQVWQNGSYINRSLAKGNPTLISKGLYLDLFLPAYIHYKTPELLKITLDSLKSPLLGGEAAQWTEIADQYNIETRIWPRAAAIAERLWSPVSATDIEDMYRRLYILSAELDEAGLQHIGNYERALRRYTGGGDISSLKTLTDLLTPIKGYKKLFQQAFTSEIPYHQTSPLIEVSDVVFVDSEQRWKFREALQSYLKNKDAFSEKILLDFLNRWESNNDRIKDLLNTSKQLEAIKEHSKNLSVVAAIGLEAMEYLKKGTIPSQEWTAEKTNRLKEINKPYGDTELSIIAEIQAMVDQQSAQLPNQFPLF